jgi:WD40 repeat protein
MGGRPRHESESKEPSNYRELLPYDELHENCERQRLHFVSRIAIISYSTSARQKFYQGHKNKISCMAVHPNKYIVATGESNANPSIHVWDSNDCATRAVLETSHGAGIINLAFSADGSLIISIGIDTFYSIQVTNWEQEEVIAFKNSSSNTLIDLVINPFNKNEFATCGYHKVQIWNIVGKSLLVKENVLVTEGDKNQLPYITCINYIYYFVGSKIVSDLIVGTNFGDIGLITGGNYFMLRKTAHRRMINCIKVTDVIRNRVVIITASEDENIRLWNFSFNKPMGDRGNNKPLGEISLRSLLKTVLNKNEDIAQSRNLSAQSIDIYACPDFSENKGPDGEENVRNERSVFQDRTSECYLLIGTRNGDILEVKLEPTIIDTLDDESETEGVGNDPLDNQLIIEKIDYEWNNELLARNHSVQLPINSNRPFDSLKHKKVNIALHPELSIMVTSGSDQQIFFWDTEDYKPFYSNSYRKTPTCIKFTPDGNLLVIGFEHGAIEICGAQMKRQITGNAGTKYSRPEMDIKQTIKEKETRTAVLNIEFSSSGDFMAASYDNLKVNREEEEGKSKEGSFVVVYMRNNSHLKAMRGQNTDSKTIYSIYTEIRRPSVNETFSSEQNIFGMAVYYMAFSADDNFLMVYFQITDDFQIRNNEDKEGIYTLWDLIHNNQINTWEALKNIPFGKFNFPNHIYGLYHYYDGNLAEMSNKQDEKH